MGQIKELLQEDYYNIKEAAIVAWVSRPTIYRHIKEWLINEEDFIEVWMRKKIKAEAIQRVYKVNME